MTFDAQNLLLRDGASHTLVVVFLRGGADGLNMVVPVEDDDYYRARPLIRVAKKDTTPLNELFGLNPALAPLQQAYGDGELLVVHGVGSEEDSRSHFEAQDYMEHAGYGAGGWLGRYLRQNPRAQNNPLAAVAFGKTTPESLRASPATIVVDSLRELSLGDAADGYLDDLATLYSGATQAWGSAGADMLTAMERLQDLPGNASAATSQYPQDGFAQHLRQVAQLIKAGLGVEAATVDLPGWDSHVVTSTLLDPLMTRLAQGLMAFYNDLGEHRKRTTVVVMTEFGRRVYENASLGTDHGRGSAMFVLGGAVRGGRVLADWPGLAEENLEGPGDLPVRYNYRDILASIIAKHLPESGLNAVFPGATLQPMEVMHA
jgi:uncharacterized protein (DUF1501 family)